MSNRICLNMVVKNHEPLIQQALESVKESIGYWVIVDAGTTDFTKAKILETLQGIPGELVNAEFENWSQLRNIALDRSDQKGDYILSINPDMALKLPDKGIDSELAADAYFISIGDEIVRKELRLFKNELPHWRYQGATFEYLASDKFKNFETLEGARFAERVNAQNEKIELQDDLEVLQILVDEFSEDIHVLFYLAKLKLQAQELETSLELFTLFLELENPIDPEWTWFALYSTARIKEQLEYPRAEIIDAYLSAFQIRPVRAEPLYELARFYRIKGLYALACLYGGQAMKMEFPAGESFEIVKAIYQWQIPIEYALSCAEQLDHCSAIEASNQALRYGKYNRGMRDSLIASRQRSVDAIQDSKKLDSPKTQTNQIRVVVPFRNAKEFLRDCIETIKTQDYNNFTATFIDDCSNDDSGSLVPLDDPRFELITNDERVGPLVNRLNFILKCDPQDIVVYLDGDDQLASDGALSYINTMYNENDCWLTYGQYISQNGSIGYAVPYASPSHLSRELEAGEMRFPIHPITHRAGLMHKLKNFDPEFKSFKDDNDEWLFYASDAVLGRPLFYMAGFERIFYCSRALYLYTEGHDISESIHNKKDQIETCRTISFRVKPPRVDNYLD